jgi:hypothetical protein
MSTRIEEIEDLLIVASFSLRTSKGRKSLSQNCKQDLAIFNSILQQACKLLVTPRQQHHCCRHYERCLSRLAMCLQAAVPVRIASPNFFTSTSHPSTTVGYRYLIETAQY